ncbi:LamG-like jellyroll fold domain-containing protein [Hyphomicrobium sp. MC8b]|uniref:LamG-like jellyroll fold domain-containing protein n=1 Tax=Hyphomicrobium sp. MC8b TaxID=300273 RepID=UPI003918BFB3
MMRIGALVMGLGLVLGLGASGARADCALEPSGSRPNGAIIKNTDYGVLQYCDGTEWRLLSFGGEGCFGEWEAHENDRDWSGLASSDDGTKLVASVNNGFIYTSSDSGATWTQRASSRAWVDVASSADGTKLVAVVANGRPYVSTDSGETWAQQDSGNRNWTAVASSADGLKLVGTVYNGRVFTSENGGAWTQRDSANRLWTDVASSADGTKLIGATDGGAVYISTNSGVAWSIRAGTEAYGVASSADGSTLAATNVGNRILMSRDSGTSWTAHDVEAPWVAVASSADGTRLAATVYGGPIYVSSDSGESWQARGMNVPWNKIALSANGKKAVAVSSGNGAIGKIYTSVCQTPSGGPGGGGGGVDACGVSTSGLGAYYRFDEASGSTVATDASGSGQTGTLVNMTPASDWVAGKLGGALDFDGNNDHVRVDNPGLPTGDFTYSTWVRTSAGVGWDCVICNAGNSGDHFELYIADGNKGYVWIEEVLFTTGALIPLNTWTHLAVRRSGSTVQLLINGVLNANSTGTYAGAMNFGSCPTLIGADGGCAGGEEAYFHGSIDDTRVYSRALSDGEIGQLYNGGAGCAG